MKKRLVFGFTAIGMMAVSALVCIMLIGMKKAQKNVQPSVGKSLTITRSLSAQDLPKSCLFSRTGTIPLTIYIVKRTPDMSIHDIDLLFLSSDKDMHPIPIGRAWSAEQLKKESVWYANFLRKNKIPRGSVVQGYQLRLAKQSLIEKNILKITVFPFDPVKNHLQWQKTGFVGITTSFSMEDSCKVPPGCPATPVINGDELQTALQNAYPTPDPAIK